jgi:hypothetical protein
MNSFQTRSQGASKKVAGEDWRRKEKIIGSHVRICVVRLYRTYLMLAVRSLADKRTNPVALQSAITSDHRGAAYSSNTLIVTLLN